jgi:hypothetical protein
MLIEYSFCRIMSQWAAKAEDECLVRHIQAATLLGKGGESDGVEKRIFS